MCQCAIIASSTEPAHRHAYLWLLLQFGEPAPAQEMLAGMAHVCIIKFARSEMGLCAREHERTHAHVRCSTVLGTRLRTTKAVAPLPSLTHIAAKNNTYVFNSGCNRLLMELVRFDIHSPPADFSNERRIFCGKSIPVNNATRRSPRPRQLCVSWAKMHGALSAPRTQHSLSIHIHKHILSHVHNT